MKKTQRNAQNDTILRMEKKKKLEQYSMEHMDTLLKRFHTSPSGLSTENVEKNKLEYGSNQLNYTNKKTFGKRFVEGFINPFTIILLCLALVSVITDIYIPIWQNNMDDYSPLTVIIIGTMVTVSGVLRMIQETRSDNATAHLLTMITTTSTIIRDGRSLEVDVEQLVVGDIVCLSAGDKIPADLRLIESKDLTVCQSALTGESEPIEKCADHSSHKKDSLTDYDNLLFMGSTVERGSGKAVVIAVGEETYFGSMAVAVSNESVQTNFSKGVSSISWVFIRFMACMVPVVFLLNGFTKGDWVQAFLFAISIAVGLTPEMLPMIITTCIAKGAVSMAKKKTVVKNLNSIQNFGSMDILCTDKTGTITEDKIKLQLAWNILGEEDTRILRHGFLNSKFQTGYKNPMDQAIIQKVEEQFSKDFCSNYKKVDEIPFDFKRRRISVLVEDEVGKCQMITKGAMEEVLSLCSYVELQDEIVLFTKELRKQMEEKIYPLYEQGMRVVAVAQKNYLMDMTCLKEEEECDMVFIGYLAFLDPPKPSTKEALSLLKQYGVSTKILTGDNEKITRFICKQVGLEVKNLKLGSQIDEMNDEQLIKCAKETQVFAKLSPDQKARIVSVLRSAGHVVGFMGDGINDAYAIKSADIGISVDTAVDIAKESADIILLEKDLKVLEEGIVEGRKTYANMMKYIKITASSNFGNVFSVLAASALLPFLPMMSLQLILLNLVYDLSCTAIPWDNVDEETLKSPKKWDGSSIGKFMIWFGPISSIFDWLTFAFLYFIFCPNFATSGILYSHLPQFLSGTALVTLQEHYESVFQTGWFIQSMWSQTLVFHFIRTKKIPFIESNASKSVTLLTFGGIFVITALPFTKIGEYLWLTPLPFTYFYFLIPCILGYMLLITIIKKTYIKKYGEFV